MATQRDLDADSVLAIAIRMPNVLAASATMADLRRHLASDHVHVALVVADGGELLACVTRSDLQQAADRDEAAPVDGLGRLEGRVVPWTATSDEVAARMASAGVRRVAVVDDRGRLVGLVCRKRSGSGFCTDEGVAARQAERRSRPA